MGNSEIRDKFVSKIDGLSDYIGLVLVDSDNYQDANTKLIEHIIKERKIPGIYVTLNKPYDIIKRKFEKEGIDTRLIIFIDGITKTAKGNPTKVKNCLFIGSPEKLSDIGLAVDQAVKSLPGKNKFVFRFIHINNTSLKSNTDVCLQFR